MGQQKGVALSFEYKATTIAKKQPTAHQSINSLTYPPPIPPYVHGCK